MEYKLPALGDIGLNMFTLLNLARQQLHRQFVRDEILYGPLQRTRAKRWIIPFLDERFPRRRRKIECDLAILQMLSQDGELNVHNLCDLVLTQPGEDDNVVDAVEKLGFKVSSQSFTEIVSRRSGRDVGGHD